MSTDGKLRALFCNDPDNDYALTMEIWHGDTVLAIVRRQAESLYVNIYPVAEPVTLPLDWLIDQLQTAREDLSKEGTQSDYPPSPS